MNKNKEKKLSFEEIQKNKVNNEIIELKKYFNIPEPTYSFSIGEEVRVGALVDSKIAEIIDKGKIYVIDYTNVDNNYGHPIKIKNCKRAIPWMDIRKKESLKESFIKNNDIKIYYSNRCLNEILNYAYHLGLDLEADYQREKIWTLSDKVDLIDSIFNNYDIGKFTFIEKGDSKPLEVLDGKQRILAILDFYEDKFEYNGYKFSDLCSKDQKYFKKYNISWGETENLSKEQILKYFIKLNTTGRVMSKKHIDKVKKMLEDCSNN